MIQKMYNTSSENVITDQAVRTTVKFLLGVITLKDESSSDPEIIILILMTL